MCPLRKQGQAGQQATKSATLVGTLHLLCVFCAILHCACGHADHHHHHHQHQQQHQHHSNSTSTVRPHHPHLLPSSSPLSPSPSQSSTSKSVLKGNTSKQQDFDDYEQRRLHRFNQRFPSMRQCQLPSSGCECLWSAKHLRGMLQTEESDQNNHTDLHGHRLYDHDEGASTTVKTEDDSAVLNRQMAVIMMANILQLGKLGVLGENDWFKCSAKGRICEQQQDQSYSHSRVHLLSTLMPNMASGDHLKRQSSSSEDHHHHQQQSEQLLSSIELFTDIESLLRQINHLLAIDQQANDDAGDDDQKKKCFDREDLLDDYQQQMAEATSASKSADHHDHPPSHEEEHEAPVNLLYIEHLTNIIVNRLASGECIELFETKFLRDIISRYGTPQSTDSQRVNNSSSSNNNQSITTLAIHQDGFVKLLNDLHIGGLIENNSTAERRSDGDALYDDAHDHDDDVHHHSRNEAAAAAAAAATASALKQSSNANSRGHRSIASVSPPTASHNHIGHQHEHHHHGYPQQSQQQQQTPQQQQQQLKRSRSSGACLDYHYYLHRQGAASAAAGADKRKALTAADLRELSPIFIQQILSGACEQLEPGEHIAGVSTTTSTSTSTLNRGGSMDTGADSLLSLSSSSHHQHSADAVGEDAWKIYVYSGISVGIISVSSICGVLMIPFLKSTYYTHIINLLIGLAFSSMAGDALLHLLPTVLGIHSHAHSEVEEAGGDGHNHSHGAANAQHDHHHEDHHHHDSAINYMGLMIAILATIYALFLFEIVSNYFASRRAGGGGGGHGHSHGHSHQQPTYQKSTATTIENQTGYGSSAKIPPRTKITATDNSDRLETYPSNSTIASILTNTDQEMASHAHHRHPHNHHDHHFQHTEEQLYRNSSSAVESPDHTGTPSRETQNLPVVFGMTSLALIITIGDSIHNLLDGVAIGIAFSNSIASGVSTSIAVLFHELPHEFGDFAVLLSTGLSVRRAAVINFLSALTAFIGLYIGILLGNNEEANRWALAICAGLFLYVALVDMLPELKEMPSTEGGSTTWVISLVVKNVGILTGAGFMIVLAKYEDLLKFD